MKVHNTLFVHNNNQHTHQLHSVMTHFLSFFFWMGGNDSLYPHTATNQHNVFLYKIYGLNLDIIP